LDRSILITTEENLINITDARTSEILDVGMALSDATLDRAKRDEKELAVAREELDHLRHLAEYYQGATEIVVYLRSELEESYKQFTKEQHLFTKKITEFQEDTLMALATCKDMERWYQGRNKK
jgi:DNA repair ATPase RecN